jgi:hypothetical protein
MRKRLASTDPETVSGIRQTISCLKDHLGTLGYGVGPVVGLLAALVVGFFNPSRSETKSDENLNSRPKNRRLT